MYADAVHLGCNTEYLVYKDRIHVKTKPRLGSIGEFCGAFYHTPQASGFPEICLNPNECIIGRRNEKNAQPKTAVALVVYETQECNQFCRRYTNCNDLQRKKHAEEYFRDDVINAVNGIFDNLQKITMYITMQPCHKSVTTQGTDPDYSCCSFLIEVAKRLDNVDIVIKPAHLSKAGWGRGANENLNRLIQNAEDGVSMLMDHEHITLSNMEAEDWEFLWTLVDHPRSSARVHLDQAIKGQLNLWEPPPEQEEEEEEGEEEGE